MPNARSAERALGEARFGLELSLQIDLAAILLHPNKCRALSAVGRSIKIYRLKSPSRLLQGILDVR